MALFNPIPVIKTHPSVKYTPQYGVLPTKIVADTADITTIPQILEIYWEDEKLPNCLLDPFYRCYRACKYGRTTDEQEITIHYNSDKSIRGISSHNWGKGAEWNKVPIEHHSGFVPVEELKLEMYSNELRYVLYVSTWNHCFESRVPNDKDWKVTPLLEIRQSPSIKFYL